MNNNSQEKNARQCLHDCAGDLMVAMLSATVLAEQLKSENHSGAKDAQSLLEYLRKTSAGLSALREILDGGVRAHIGNKPVAEEP